MNGDENAILDEMVPRLKAAGSTLESAIAGLTARWTQQEPVDEADKSRNQDTKSRPMSTGDGSGGESRKRPRVDEGDEDDVVQVVVKKMLVSLAG